MSWARVDDGLWEHEKFEALRESHDYRATALWFLSLSYCGQKGNARVTVREALMLLCCSEADAQDACDVLRSRGLFDDDSASKQTRSYLIHDWEEYRSKDEAKALAGRKGGERSGESRRSKSKQTRSTIEAPPHSASKQTRTPDPDPDPDSDPVTRYPIPTPIPSSASLVTTNPNGLTASELNTALLTWEGWGIHGIIPKWWPMASGMEPFSAAELDYARREAESIKGKPNVGLLLRIIERERAKGIAQPQAHKPGVQRLSPKAETLRRGAELLMHSGGSALHGEANDGK